MGFLFYGLGGVGVDKVNAVFFKLLIEVEAKLYYKSGTFHCHHVL